MTWHLKDRELEKKLNELTKGEFSKNLHQYDDEHYSSFFGEILSFTEDCGYEFDESAGKGVYRQSQFLFFFNNDAIEEVPEYNPNGWNEFPAVTPPEGELMRVELFNLMLRKFTRACAIYCNGTWYAELNGEPNGTLELAGMTKVKRFRPWED